MEQLRSKVLNEGYTDKDFNEAAKSIQTSDNTQENTQNTTTDPPKKEYKYKYQHLKSPKPNKILQMPHWLLSISMIIAGYIAKSTAYYLGNSISLIGTLVFILGWMGFILFYLGILSLALEWLSISFFAPLCSLLKKRKSDTPSLNELHIHPDTYFSSVNKIMDEHKRTHEPERSTKKTLSLKIITSILVLTAIERYYFTSSYIAHEHLRGTSPEIATVIIPIITGFLLLSAAYGLWNIKKWAFDFSMLVVGLIANLTVLGTFYIEFMLMPIRFVVTEPQLSIVTISAKLTGVYLIIFIFIAIELMLYKNKKYYKL
ncbi:MAG: hypothetical protein U9R43_17825 [Thermodesulfobacteriota bacterium]|nr:hypothetical protein [Thermodesulfobacteriota bacterium]